MKFPKRLVLTCNLKAKITRQQNTTMVRVVFNKNHTNCQYLFIFTLFYFTRYDPLRIIKECRTNNLSLKIHISSPLIYLPQTTHVTDKTNKISSNIALLTSLTIWYFRFPNIIIFKVSWHTTHTKRKVLRRIHISLKLLY